jgi:hypothetical protein
MNGKNSGPDGYVRIPTSALPGVELIHLASDRDPSIATGDDTSPTTITGYTEWVGLWENMTITIGWDWAVVKGAIVVLNPNEIRTNILLVSPDGVAEPAAIAKIHLFHWIDSMPWRQIATEDLTLDDDPLTD